MTSPPCALCGDKTRHFLEVSDQRYWRCTRCELTQLDEAHWLDAEAERAVYAQHTNSAEEVGYRRFLSKLAIPLLERVPPGSRGLDYGCGPGPALAEMLQEAGHDMALYDPFFREETTVLADTYDFITCTEVAEHFQRPGVEFARLDALLREGGWLAVMTCFQTDDARFASWHYRRDPTHVVFYRAHTMQMLAEHHGWECVIPVKDVALFRKPSSG